MAYLRILLLSIGASVVYGILHDQITARVSIEYFTVGHPPIFPTESPTWLGLGWGILATWWVGLLLGIPLAWCAQAGPPPRLGAKDLLVPVALLLLGMGVLALAAGTAGYWVVIQSGFRLEGIPPDRLSEARQPRFLACWCAHLASYASGLLGGLGLCLWTRVRRRRRAAGNGRHPQGTPGPSAQV